MNNSTTTISTVVATPNYLLLLIDWPFFILHLSLVLFVAVRVVKRNVDFSGGFYVLFLYLAGVDALYFLESLICYRLANSGFMIDFIVESMSSNGAALFVYEATYLNWAPGYPKAGDNCAIADSNDGQHLVWKSYGCDPSMTQLGFSLCQGPACDATTTICCADCYYCEINPNCGIFPKKKAIKKRSKKDRLIRKMAKVNGRMVRVA